VTAEERLATLERRLERVSYHNRCLSVALGLVAGALVVTWALGSVTPPAQAASVRQRELRARRFVVQGADGEIRATLGMTEAGSGLTLCDAAGRTRAVLDVNADGPWLTLLDETGAPRVVLDIASGRPSVKFMGEASDVLWSAP